jgi:hypothetical protein
VVERRVFLRAETKKNNEEKFKGLADWRVAPGDKEYWKCISRIIELE